MRSFKEHLTEATINTENVKEGIVTFINDALLNSAAKTATIKIGNHKIHNVVAAKPSNLSSTGGVLPYTDIELILSNKSTVNVGLRVAKGKKFLVYRGNQLRGAGIPALYDGIHSLEKMYPEAREHYLASALEYYRNKGYEHGVDVPTVYGRIMGKMKEELLLGSGRFGGKVDYIFAIDRARLTYRKMRIPDMKSSYKGKDFVITIGDAKAFTDSEILSNNDVYMWAWRRDDRLYLGNDKVGNTNLPAVFGPPRGGPAKEYGVKKYRVGLNVSSKESMDIKNNSRVFKLELRNPQDLKPEQKQDGADTMNDTPSQDRGYKIYSQPASKEDSSEYGTTLDPDQREELLDRIIDKIVTGMKHRYKEDLDRDQLDMIRTDLEDRDDADLQRMFMSPGHRLAVEIRKDYL